MNCQFWRGIQRHLLVEITRRPTCSRLNDFIERLQCRWESSTSYYCCQRLPTYLIRSSLTTHPSTPDGAVGRRPQSAARPQVQGLRPTGRLAGCRSRQRAHGGRCHVDTGSRGGGVARGAGHRERTPHQHIARAAWYQLRAMDAPRRSRRQRRSVR